MGAKPAVCIVRHNYYPDTHVRRDAEALAQAGYDVSVVSLRRPGQPGRETLHGVQVYRQPVRHVRGSVLRYLWEYGAFLALATFTVARLHATKRFRVVEVDNMPDILVLSALIPRLTGARVLLYIFDNMPELLSVTRHLSPRHPAVRLLALLERLSAGLADRVVVTQDTARRLLLARGTPAAKLAVVLNCPDEALFAPRPPRPPRRREAERLEIVTHGTILERYGIQVLIEALPLIAAAAPRVRLQIFGEGEFRPALEAQARRLGVAERVHFRGLVPLEELIAGLTEADVGYAGMLCDNMISNKLMEYVALGVPAVVPSWPTFERYFPPDSVVYYQPGGAQDLARAVLSIHSQPDEAYRRASRASALSHHFGWAAQRPVYLGIYAELLTAAGERPPAPSVEVPSGAR